MASVTSLLGVSLLAVGKEHEWLYTDQKLKQEKDFGYFLNIDGKQCHSQISVRAYRVLCSESMKTHIIPNSEPAPLSAKTCRWR